jgi:hypothetical protein
LRVFIPNEPWEEPVPLTYEKATVVNGHTPFGAKDHPHAIEDLTGVETAFYASLFIIIVIIGVVSFRRWKRTKAEKQDIDKETSH